MELKEFIKTALADIVEGVRQANDELCDDVVLCYHTDKAYNGYPSVTYKTAMHERQAPMTVVNFRVQVRVDESRSTEGKAKVGVLNVIGGGIDGKVARANETTQELDFSIPMVWKTRR